MADLTQQLANQVQDAYHKKYPLSLQGSGTKAFLGHPVQGHPLALTAHRGILHYEPSELVLTARAGTPLAEIEAQLEQEKQMLAFEPPYYGDTATLGGTIACGLSGPRRPYAGAARDFVLGCQLINGKGEVLNFGGEVMKNVAGYDLSRLQVGAYGTLGLMLTLSLKVLPKPETELTLIQECQADKAIQQMNTWAAKPLPLSASCYDGQWLYIRLSGAETAIQAAQAKIGGEPYPAEARFWQQLREQQLTFFDNSEPLWRCAVPPATPPLNLPGKQLIDWGGGQRWLYTDIPAEKIRHQIAQINGHATLFRHPAEKTISRFHPLSPGILRLHQQLKNALDPAGIFNPARLYPTL